VLDRRYQQEHFSIDPPIALKLNQGELSAQGRAWAAKTFDSNVQ
jgi:hypothetical protein